MTCIQLRKETPKQYGFPQIITISSVDCLISGDSRVPLLFCVHFAYLQLLFQSSRTLKDEMLDSRRLAWIKEVEPSCFQKGSTDASKNCHANSSSHTCNKLQNWAHQLQTAKKLNKSQLSRFSNRLQPTLPSLTSGLFLFLLLSGVVEARTNGANRRTGEVLPYDPMDARYF